MNKPIILVRFVKIQKIQQRDNHQIHKLLSKDL